MDIESVALDQVKPYHNNPRKGNVEIIAESLKTYGQYQPITVNKRTGEILAGNHTYQAAETLGWEKIAVTYVDVDETTAAKIVAIDNRSSDLSQYDKIKLADLLESIPELTGSGYTFEEFDDLKAEIQELSMPHLTEKTYFSSLEAGETGQSGTRFIPSLGDYAERYTAKSTRMLMCDYHNDVYVWVIDQLIKYRTQEGLTNNADAIIHLIENALGEKAPSEVI